MQRRLDPDEAALWARVTATIRPLSRRAASPLSAADQPGNRPKQPANPAERREQPRPPSPPARRADANTLDGGWDRRISAGRITPDVTVDLHGHNLTTAHATLERRLSEAIAQGHRVMLVITGRPPRAEQDPERPRGLIRQQLPHWLATSPHRSAVAAVRGAHPRHGGAGALYLVLRRRRDI